MRSAAAAFAWEFRARHRWGWTALAAYFALLAIIRTALVTRGRAIAFADEETFALAVAVPLATTFIYFLGVFTFGLSGDVGGRASIYPARMFTLPVTNDALVAWPMLYGSLATAVLWALTRAFSLWPASLPVPVVWPLILGPALLAWTQALTWMPYPLRGMRVIVTILWLAMIDAIVMIALQLKAPEPLMAAIIAPQLPLAYFLARSAVRRARRGDVPDWHLADTRFGRGRGPFPSAVDAMTWYEWREHGRSLPLFVAILLPFEMAMLFIFNETPAIVVEMLLLALTTPSFMAFFIAATVRRSNAGVLPVPNGSIIAAKFRATLRSAAFSWLLVLTAVPLAVISSGTAPVVTDIARSLVSVVGTPRAIGAAALTLALLMLSTWKQLVQSLYIGMSGREWVAKASIFGALAVASIILPLAHVVSRSHALIAIIWKALPWILATLAFTKIAAASWIVVRLQREQLVGRRTLLAGAIAWDLAVFATYGIFVWIVPELVVRHYVFAFLAILIVPLTRLAAAPLVLARNRSR